MMSTAPKSLGEPAAMYPLPNPRGIVYDWFANRLIVSGEARLYSIEGDGKVSVFAGSADPGLCDGCEEAKFHSPTGVCFARDGLLYVCDYRNHAGAVLPSRGPDGIASSIRRCIPKCTHAHNQASRMCICWRAG